jgi:hypothetical protein
MNEALAVIEPGDSEEARPSQALTLFGTADPVAVIDKAAQVAAALAKVIRKQKLFTTIAGKEHIHVEGWTLLGSMLGVFPQVEWTRKLEDGWEARVVATVAANGAVVGAGEAQCLRGETKWAGRDDYALRAMAQTRATSRALRGPLGFVVVLAGFAATPAEEMDGVGTTHEQFAVAEDARRAAQRAGAAPPLSPTPANPTHEPSSPARTATEILDDTRKRMGTVARKGDYADEDAVCPQCGAKDFIRPYQGSFFCSRRDGGCGHPPKGEKWVFISYGEWRKRQSK